MNKLSQAEVDKMMVDLGIERYSRSVGSARERKQETATKPGQLLLSSSIEKFQATIDAWIARAATTPGRSHVSVAYLKQLPTDVTAFIAAQLILDQMCFDAALMTTASGIASALEDEVRFAAIKKDMAVEWRSVMRRLKTKSESHRRKVMRGSAAKLGDSWEKWTFRHKVQIGTVLIDLFAASTGLIDIVLERDGRKHERSVIRATPECLEWLEKSHEAHKVRAPFYLPTVTPPEPWVSLREGGYASNVFMRWPLFSARHGGYDHFGTYEEMPRVYDAINTLQKTPWEIDGNVFAVFDYFWKEGLKCESVPPRENEELPPIPEDMDTNEVARKAWRQQAAIIHQRNAEAVAKRMTAGKIHRAAQSYQNQPFWFPYKGDFRGRIYPIPSFLQPQGCKLAKGLLRFHQGAPLDTDEAIEWFLIHGANTWGEDKVIFEDRVKWATEAMPMVMAIAEDPLENRQWMDADSPWCFLAWCFEVADWADDPSGFQSKIPIAMDGSNNGLQIYSLLLRDTAGAEATNVKATGEVRDIYSDVADKVHSILIDCQYKKEEAAAWLKFLDGKPLSRKATKRVVMVAPYGGTLFSSREFVEEWYEDQIAAMGRRNDRPFADTFSHTKYLATLIWQAIAEVVVGASGAMDWLRAVSKVCTKHQIPITWTTPMGFKVKQAVMNTKSERIITQIGKVVRNRTARVNTSKLSPSGQANGFPPNFIHSLDASLLMLSIERAKAEGITSFAMIHDSYGVLARDASKMARVLREATVEIFTPDLLEDLENQIRASLPEGTELPERPKLGDLDPRCVLDSPYYFA